MKRKIHDYKTVHLVGIKGQGMAALCELLIAEGKYVTGSDTEEPFSTDAVLQKLGIRVRRFQKKNITKSVDVVVRSSAYGETHVEIVAARLLAIPVVNYIDAVGELFNKKRGILVTGTHGKTTTTALIGLMLEDAELDPTVLVGATVRRWKSNAHVGKGAWMVAEGDEYQNKFLKLRPEVLVLTSIEHDHPDFFKTKKQYEEAFRTLVSHMPSNGLLIAEKRVRRIIKKAPCNIVWYGIAGKGEGRHMELNKTAALCVARHLGISVQKAKRSLNAYEGTSRRMEFYTALGAPTVVIDDYAHHPTEVRTTLAAVRRQYPKRMITTLFQPHTYSRTHALLGDFSRAFGSADEVVLLPIYSSARERKEDFPVNLLERLRDGIRRAQKKTSVRILSFPEAIAYGKHLPPIRKKRVIITLGAGDGWKIAKTIVLSSPT